MYKYYLLFAAMYLIFLACKKEEDKTEPGINTAAISCDSVDSKFSTGIAPIMSKNCALGGCHAGSGRSGVVLETYEQIRDNAGMDRFLIAIKRTKENGVSPMPRSGPLSANDVRAIECWIEEGRQNN